jgi:hypothetical protein
MTLGKGNSVSLFSGSVHFIISYKKILGYYLRTSQDICLYIISILFIYGLFDNPDNRLEFRTRLGLFSS